MENKINIAELIKHCPQGTKLYSPLCGECYFDRLNMGTIICKKQNTQEITFTSNGYYMLPVFDGCECLLFPSKENRDWSKFQRPFKDGDIIYTKIYKYEWISIFEKFEDNKCKCHIDYDTDLNTYYSKVGGEKSPLCEISEPTEQRLATKEEKAKLFQAIKDNGYTWNEETKTLDKLMKFKDGDIVFTRTSKYDWVSIFKQFSGNTYHTYGDLHIYSNNLFTNTHILCDIEEINTQRLATKEEKQKLFDAIEANGYKWNKENKTLVKLPKFKDGDIVFYNDTIAIFKEWGDETLFRAYVIKYLFNNHAIVRDAPLFGKSIRREIRFATKEEKEKLFQAIKDNGYKWNEETKTLEKLIEPIFKVGDRIKNKNDKWLGTRTIQSYVVGIGYFTTINDWVRIEDQDEYELVPDIKPKFNVGDKVKSKMSENIFTVIDIKDDVYIFSRINDRFGYHVPFRLEKDYELVHRKFDINTLKPFESRVLMRSSNAREWVGTMYSHYNNNKFYGCGMCCDQCIPYEGNEDLLGTTDDCDEYFKIWE